MPMPCHPLQALRLPCSCRVWTDAQHSSRGMRCVASRAAATPGLRGPGRSRSCTPHDQLCCFSLRLVPSAEPGAVRLWACHAVTSACVWQGQEQRHVEGCGAVRAWLAERPGAGARRDKWLPVLSCLPILGPGALPGRLASLRHCVT